MIAAVKLNNAVNVSRATDAAAARGTTPKSDLPFVIQFTGEELRALIGSLSETAMDGTIQDRLWHSLRKIRDERL